VVFVTAYDEYAVEALKKGGGLSPEAGESRAPGEDGEAPAGTDGRPVPTILL
jgi:hypothetical protein